MAKHTQRGGSPALSQRRYTPEFKRDAVALYETSGKSIAAVARELGMNDVTLGAWIHDQEKGRRTAESEETAADRAEAARLRKQIKELEDEVEILKRFTAYWVKEKNR
jgi:transposase